MPCTELFRNRMNPGAVQRERFESLHPDGRRLIQHWFARAWDQRECEPFESFEPFIYTWIALNGWANRCTGWDQDRMWLDALIQSEEFNRLFADQIAASTAFNQEARQFRELWPVFRAQEIRRLGICVRDDVGRAQVVDQFLRGGAKQLAPDCWIRHRTANEQPPLDWAHTLSVLYRIRCNLFHGDKVPHSETDRKLVSAGFRVLVHFLAEATNIR